MSHPILQITAGVFLGVLGAGMVLEIGRGRELSQALLGLLGGLIALPFRLTGALMRRCAGNADERMARLRKHLGY